MDLHHAGNGWINGNMHYPAKLKSTAQAFSVLLFELTWVFDEEKDCD